MEDIPFDVIFDLGVGRKEAWTAAKNFSTLKKSGTYVTFSGHNPEMKIHNICDTIGLIGAVYGRVIGSACWPFIPKYVLHSGFDLENAKTLKELFRLVLDGKLKVVMDPISPLPFTADGIKSGFHIMNAREAHGKIVVKIAE